MGTAVFYADDHHDIREKDRKRRTHSAVYPTYKVKGLKVAKVKILKLDGYDQVDFLGESVIDGGKLHLEAHPERWKRRITKRYGDTCSSSEGSDVISLPGNTDLFPLQEMIKRDKVQYHVDPDAFLEKYLIEYFGKSPRAREGKCNTVFSWSGTEDPPAHFKLSRLLGTEFFGVFEWYITKIRGEYAGTLLADLKDKAIPKAKYVLLPRYIIEHLPPNLKLGKSEILALDIMDDDGKLITNRRKGPPFGSVKLEGKPFDINELLRYGKVFFASESHADALLFFDSKPSESEK